MILKLLFSLETPSSNEFYERKFLKLLKWKKKKKKKKKIILFKLFIGILVFLAVKFLLKKAFKFVPAVSSSHQQHILKEEKKLLLTNFSSFLSLGSSICET